MKAFEEAAFLRFEEQMVLHGHGFSPKLCEVIGDRQLRVALRQARLRATGHGFTFRGPLRLYVEMMFLCGSDFDTDPQFPAVGRILRTPGDQMARAEQLYGLVLDYQKKVAGTNLVFTRKALNDLLALIQNLPAFSSTNFLPGMLREMHRVYPQRAEYIGDPALTALIREGQTKARQYDFPIRGEVLIVTLMSAFGHGCIDDPLYPWIANTLNDERIVSASARAERLEKKAATWLKHVLAEPQKSEDE